MDDLDLNAGQRKFLNEMTRKLLVEWAHEALTFGHVTVSLARHGKYLEHAKKKGWVSKKPIEQDENQAMHKLTSAGYTSAANFLKR